MVVSTVSKYIVLNILHYEHTTCDTAARSEPRQTFEVEAFAKLINGIKERI